MYPYEAAVHAGVGSVMASFNEVDGVPATANRWLMTDVLRKQWGFNGFVVTDFTGISEMVEHGIGDLQTVSARALNAGVDMDMVSEGFVGTLKKSLTEGKITMKTLDAACRRILEARKDGTRRLLALSLKRFVFQQHKAFGGNPACGVAVLAREDVACGTAEVAVFVRVIEQP